MNPINIAGKKSYPSKIVCIGRNYVEHINELNNEIPDQAVIFVKPNSAIDTQLASNNLEPIHYEAEICFVIERNQIKAVGIGLDLTKRDLQSILKSKGLPWERAKAFDKSAVFSDFVHFSGEVDRLSMQLLINGVLIQFANYDLMIHKPTQIMKEISAFMSFCDGDIIMTGTPKGVGVVLKGDVFIGRIYQDDTLLIEQQWQAS
jgi:2-keto-4-pentenoate hydratase/2-oxohepta-3-ene-1,7-dioic acid hydratase in catechol pathway